MARYIDADKLTAEDIRNLDLLPGEKVAPVVHAKWIATYGSESEGWYTCSNCKCELSIKRKYCPECGAKMDESERNDEV